RWWRLAAVGAALVVVAAVVAVGYFTRNPWHKTEPPPGPASNSTPWQPRAPLTPEELAKLRDPLDDWRREDIPAGTLAPLAGDKLDSLPELIGLLGDGPFRFFSPDATHWPVQNPDGRLLAIAHGNDVVLFDTETGAVVRTLAGHTGRAFRGGFSSDGKRYA